MISKATAGDIPALVALLNSAYRGEVSKQGWTSEADMIQGTIRTDPNQLQQLMENPCSCFLKYQNDKDEIEGCVFLDKRNGKLYLGMLSVNPALQARGTGKKLMQAAEAYAREEKCPAIFMRVVSIRHELIAWYERQGYQKTGQAEPFEDSKYGTATAPFEFLLMEKTISPLPVI
ncbi:MAG: GNAT family N-acetyltransferase [Chitinophagaceae bacterium]